MRVLVTGGAGFIGSHLCDYFLNKGHSVIAIDNMITGNERNINHLKGHRRFRFKRRDVSQYINIAGPLGAVLHFASPASPDDYHKFPIPTLKVGALGTHNALGLAKKKKAVFLLASTSEVYGDPQENPQRESYWGNVNPVGPRGVYDEAKRFAEAMTMAYHHYHHMQVRIARLFNVYGPRMRVLDGRAIPNFLGQALLGKPITINGSGKQTRSFCYIDDIVDGIYRLLVSRINAPVNIGNPHEMRVNNLAQKIKQLTKSKSRLVHRPLPEDDPKVRRPDISLARQRLHWRPQVTFDEGLKQTIAYFRKVLKK